MSELPRVMAPPVFTVTLPEVALMLALAIVAPLSTVKLAVFCKFNVPEVNEVIVVVDVLVAL